VSISFTDPINNSGSPITGYKYTCTGPGTGTGNAVPFVNNPLTINGLTTGITYSFYVAAVNGAGDGTYSVSSNATPCSAPAAPTIISITTGIGLATINFTDGSSNGYAITNHKYCIDGSSSSTWITCDPPVISSPIIINGLSNNRSYTINILATNSIGDSPYSNEWTPIIPEASSPYGPFATLGTNTNIGITNIPNLTSNSNVLALTAPMGVYFTSPNLYCSSSQIFNLNSTQGFTFNSGTSRLSTIDKYGSIWCNGLNIVGGGNLTTQSSVYILGQITSSSIMCSTITPTYDAVPTFTTGQIGYTFNKNTSDLSSDTISGGPSNLYTISTIPIGCYMVTTQVTLSGVNASNVASIGIKLNGNEPPNTAVSRSTIVLSKNTLSINYVLTNNNASGIIVITISMVSGSSTYESGFLQICRIA
jgi:hypothetical protein